MDGASIIGAGRPLNVMQRQLLVLLISQKKTTLEDRSHGIAAVQKKQAAWEEIHSEFNGISGRPQNPPTTEAGLEIH